MSEFPKDVWWPEVEWAMNGHLMIIFSMTEPGMWGCNLFHHPLFVLEGNNEE